MNTSNYDPKTESNSYSNSTIFSYKRFGELVLQVEELQEKIAQLENIINTPLVGPGDLTPGSGDIH